MAHAWWRSAWLVCACIAHAAGAHATPAAADADADAITAADRAALAAAGYTHAHLESRELVHVYLARAGKAQRLVLVAVTAAPAHVIELGPPPDLRRGNLDVGARAFLDEPALLDVDAKVVWSNGMGGSSVERHYVARLGDHPALACAFDGSSSDGMEDRWSSETVEVRRVSAKPLAFEVTTTSNADFRTLQQRRQPNGQPPAPRHVTYRVRADGTCAADPTARVP